jgi:hypothetical protein
MRHGDEDRRENDAPKDRYRSHLKVSRSSSPLIRIFSTPIFLAPVRPIRSNTITPLTGVLYAAIAQDCPFLAVAFSHCDTFRLSAATDL